MNALGLAAAPTFAVMALLTQIHSSSTAAMLCAPMHDMFPVDGMVLMYALMSVFHVGPWLKLIRSLTHHHWRDCHE
jgi:hypothetical protein